MKLLYVGTKKHPGLFAKVDDADFEHLNQWKWSAEKRRNGFYAIRGDHKAGTTVRMHREILGCPEDVDHKDGDGLNNQRHNLRPCSEAQNSWNVKKHTANATSRYKGVSWSKRFLCWVAFVKANGKHKNLGCFDTEEAAALAYNIGAVERHGAFARINEGPTITEAQMEAARHRRPWQTPEQTSETIETILVGIE